MSRVLDSWSALVTKINTLSFNMFQRNMQPITENVNKMTDKISSEDIYSYFLYKVSYMYKNCTYIRMHVCKKCVYLYVCMCVCVCVCMCVYVCVRVCMYTVCIAYSTYVYVTCISILITLQLDVAIGHEITYQYEQALGMYNDLHLLLEQTIAKHSSDSHYQYPQWLKKMTSS